MCVVFTRRHSWRAGTDTWRTFPTNRGRVFAARPLIGQQLSGPGRSTIHVSITIVARYYTYNHSMGRLGSRVVSVLDSGAEGPGFKSQLRRCRVTVLGKLFTPIVPLFTKHQNL